MAITQGDQYPVPIIIKKGDTIFTDQNVTAVRVALDGAVRSYPNGGLTYSNDAWWFPLTQELSYTFQNGKVQFQAQVKIDDKVIGTGICNVEIDDSIFKETW